MKKILIIILLLTAIILISFIALNKIIPQKANTPVGYYFNESFLGNGGVFYYDDTQSIANIVVKLLDAKKNQNEQVFVTFQTFNSANKPITGTFLAFDSKNKLNFFIIKLKTAQFFSTNKDSFKTIHIDNKDRLMQEFLPLKNKLGIISINLNNQKIGFEQFKNYINCNKSFLRLLTNVNLKLNCNLVANQIFIYDP